MNFQSLNNLRPKNMIKFFGSTDWYFTTTPQGPEDICFDSFKSLKFWAPVRLLGRGSLVQGAVCSSKSSVQAEFNAMTWEKSSSSSSWDLSFKLKLTSAHCANCSQVVDVSLSSKLRFRYRHEFDLELFFSSSHKYLSWSANSNSALICYTTLVKWNEHLD